MEVLTLLLQLLAGLLDQLDTASALLLDFELTIRLAHDPAVVELPARPKFVKEGHEVPPAIIDTRAKVRQRVHTAVPEGVGYL